MPTNPYQFTAKEREYRAAIGSPSVVAPSPTPSPAVCSEGHTLSWRTYPVPDPIGDVRVMWCTACGGEA